MFDRYVTQVSPARYRKETSRNGIAFYTVDSTGRIVYTNRRDESRVVTATVFERAYANGYNKSF